MTRPIFKSSEAMADLLDAASFYAQDTLDVAERFLSAAESSIARLAAFPNIGRQYEGKVRGVDGVRWISIAGFESFLVFYRPEPDVIRILRVIHGARDIPGLFEDT